VSCPLVGGVNAWVALVLKVLGVLVVLPVRGSYHQADRAAVAGLSSCRPSRSGHAAVDHDAAAVLVSGRSDVFLSDVMVADDDPGCCAAVATQQPSRDRAKSGREGGLTSDRSSPTSHSPSPPRWLYPSRPAYRRSGLRSAATPSSSLL
jgi:hypothetical protein